MSKLFLLLEKLERKEWTRLEKFVRSPYFNQRQDVVKLLVFIRACFFDYGITPSKEKMFDEVYPGEAFCDQKIRTIMSQLHRLCLFFLTIESFREEQIEQKITLAKVLRKKRLDKHYKKNLKEGIKKLANIGLQNADFYQYQYSLQEEEYRYLAAQKRLGEFNLQSIADNLDISYLAQKLRQACLILSHQAVYKKEYALGLINPLLPHLEDSKYLEIPAVSLYYYAYKMLTKPDQIQFFDQLKTNIFQYSGQFPRDEVRDLYLLAINYCIKQYNRGNPALLKDEFELYQDGLKKEVFIQEGIMSRFTYLNITTIALALKSYDWLASFIDTYRSRLEKQGQEAIYSLCKARLQYQLKEYDASLKLLQKANFKDFYLNLSVRTLMLKIYYELEEFDVLWSHLDAMKVFIRRKEFMGYTKENYLNTIRFMQRILELPPGDREQRKRLADQIKEAKSVAEKAWLLGLL